ncbi:MAG: cytochrome c biogenesis protein CcsA [Tannerella sp.]|jgi:ABC-type transport system involved in cytochrome c biogenesis permease subunit|nr:cytochrome c biogenesis protein CcsA [Tannerella sp.]
MKLLKRISFFLLGVMLAVLVLATVFGKLYGADFVAEYVYGSVPFLALWIAFAASVLVYLLKRKIWKKPAAAALHFSFLLILAGALITWFFGEQGTLHIRKDKETACFVDHDGTSKEMPFTVKLNSFHIVYYAGTRAPMDFVSSITISDAEKGKITEEVAMNRILSYGGYRFYQSGYDEDENGVTLAVSHDPYGIAVTYFGYALLLLSIASFFLNRRSGFRRLLRHPLPACSVSVWLLFFCASDMQAVGNEAVSEVEKQVLSVGMPKALPRSVAAKFGDLYVLYNGRICPFQTLAKDFTVKLYGSSSYKGLTPEQVFTGWMFYYSSWKEQPVIKVKNKAVRRILGIKGRYASLDDFYGDRREYKLETVVRDVRSGGVVEGRRGVEDADEKYNLIAILYSGKLLKIYPHERNDAFPEHDAGHIEWYSQGDPLPEDMGEDEWLFVKKSFDYIHEMIVGKDYDGVSDTLDKIKIYQRKKAGDVLPPDSRFKAEKIYNALNYTKHLAMFCLFAGVVSFLLYCNRLVNGRKVSVRIRQTLGALEALVFLYLTTAIGLRWYVSAHAPLSNGFETMQFMAWCAVLLSFLLRRRFFMSLPFGFLLCGLTLLVAMLGESDPRITQLMPVLSSPLLSLHVVVIMISYSLFAFMMLNGVTAVVLSFAREGNPVQVERLYVVSRIILYPAVFCLATGIFVGAVWANISWGRYWGWDPKEVWALIIMLLYSLALHTDSLPLFRRPMFFHVFSIIAFLSVPITYFGVNLILGGMHSYA